MKVLVTGGAGYIGSHTVVELISAGHEAFIVDNFVNSDRVVLDNLKELTGKEQNFIELDIRDTDKLAEYIKDNQIDSIIHFAALKAVGESVNKPLDYYQNNIVGLLSVLQAAKDTGVNKLIFSSSCTVYGDPDKIPVDESAQLKTTTNPYGETKQMAERMLSDVSAASELKVVSLRYFNPIGAHPSSLIGELPVGPPYCLVPYLTQSVAGLRDPLTVHGDDYDTPDGSGIRDYIHVVDLAKAHVKALEYLEKQQDNISFFNIGTGKGFSVLEIINTFEKVNNIKVDYKIGPRRSGDIASIYALPDKAEKELGWKAKLSLEDALRDAWNWQQKLAS